MNALIIGLLAETFIHPGSGRSSGAIDLPVAREAATDYPFIAGSGIKGALKDHARQQNFQQLDTLFGEPDNAGTLLAGDARLLLLPVRSLTSSYKWATCPHLLERYLRDLRRCGGSATMTLSSPPAKTVFGDGTDQLFLEERLFDITGPVPNDVITTLKTLIPHSDTRNRLDSQLVILSDDDFAWFARYGLAVQARNVLDEVTKESKNLWYEETLPPDTLLYCTIIERQTGGVNDARTLLNNQPYLQLGGNETVGQGWFALSLLTPNLQPSAEVANA
ncbi:MAG: type III-B CRISPR module RAMP protein Cmr4 [Pedobacter sp.]